MVRKWMFIQNQCFYKFMPSKRKIAELGMSLTPEVTMKDDNDWPVNLPILRLEDMMLMYAELLVEEGKIMEAVDLCE